jgi:hypothetical protein
LVLLRYLAAMPDYDLAARMAELEAPDPEGWAQSEANENIPQEGRWIFIKHIWQAGIDSVTAARNPHCVDLLEAGVDAELLTKALRFAAFDAMMGVVMALDNSRDFQAPADAPGWLLVETRADDFGQEQPTGREIAGLHESILQGDLTGGEGSDFLQL